MKRAGVFCFYNKDGIVREYVIHLIDSISKYLSDLFVVCNGIISEDGKKSLLKFTDQIYIRDNIGYDAAAFKYVILEKLGKNRLSIYDELLIFNDTFYGPFFSMDAIIKEMEMDECDFWGLTAHNAVEAENIPYHIQSYFIDFKDNVLHSDCFINFWKCLKGSWKSVVECINDYEMKLTPYFNENGFKASSYVKSDYSHNIYIDHPLETITKYNLPIVKKKIFQLPVDSFQNYQAQKVFDHIINNYKCDYIIEDLLSMADISALKQRLGFSLIVKPCNGDDEKYKIISKSNDTDLKGIYINGIESIMDDDLVLVDMIDKENNDEKEIGLIKENLCYDESYVSGILDIFKNRKEAGCLMPELLRSKNRLDIVSGGYENFGCFWIRGMVLNQLIKKSDGFDNMIKLSGAELAQMVQNEGYITYTVKNEIYAVMTDGLRQYYLSEIINSLSRNYEFYDLNSLVDTIVKDRVHIKRIKHIVQNKLKNRIDI